MNFSFTKNLINIIIIFNIISFLPAFSFDEKLDSLQSPIIKSSIREDSPSFSSEQSDEKEGVKKATKKIIIIEPGSSVLAISKAVESLGFEPAILCSIDEYGGDQKAHLLKCGYYEVDARSVENIIHCIKKNNITEIIGIMSTADRFIC